MRRLAAERRGNGGTDRLFAFWPGRATNATSRHATPATPPRAARRPPITRRPARRSTILADVATLRSFRQGVISSMCAVAVRPGGYRCSTVDWRHQRHLRTGTFTNTDFTMAENEAQNSTPEQPETSAEPSAEQTTATEEVGQETAGEAQHEAAATQGTEQKLNLQVEVSDAGPCRKHVAVTVPAADVKRLFEEAVEEFRHKVDVPGFRRGHAPATLIMRRFRDELSAEIKQKVLLESMEQAAEQAQIEPIDEPDIELENLEIPEEGDFFYEFEVEVRPRVELPDFSEWTLEQPSTEIKDEDIDHLVELLLSNHGEFVPKDGPVEPGDYVVATITIRYKGKELAKLHDQRLHVVRELRFPDATLKEFDKLLQGALPGDKRVGQALVSTEADLVPLRGEVVEVEFHVIQVEQLKKPDPNDSETLNRLFGVSSLDELRERCSTIIRNRLEYQQRQAIRKQIREKLAASSNWELPEKLVRKQVENAMHRELLEMRQAGYTPEEIAAYETSIRQRALTTTRNALIEHFILDRIAEDNQLEPTDSMIDMEILNMAFSSGESPRRIRARLFKSGVIENLAAQLRERMAVDWILERVQTKEVPAESLFGETDVETVDTPICTQQAAARLAAEQPTAPAG
ncbi:MAG: trigger factor [Planctomycetota bacterium]|nr:MAG: trigger factor [Planctomycetota bacterium]